MLDKRDGTVVESSPKAAGWEDLLYAVESVDAEHDGLIEALFGLAENYSSPSLRRLLGPDARASFSDADRGNLAFLIAAQEQRVPGALKDLELQMVISGSALAAVELANLRGARRRRRRGRESAEALIAGRVSLRPSASEVLDTALTGIAHVAHMVYAMPWTLLRVKDDAARFVCSDRPLSMVDPTPPHRFSAPGWMSSPNVKAFMPLGSTACLRISPGDQDRLAVRPTSRQVESINRRTYAFADRFVYGGSRETLEDLHAWACLSPGDVPQRIPKRMVLLETLETADAAVADANEARGWDRYLSIRRDDGSFETVSYEVIDTLEDAMRAIAPRQVPGCSADAGVSGSQR